MNKKVTNVMKKMVKSVAMNSVETASMFCYHQPKAPSALKKESKEK